MKVEILFPEVCNLYGDLQNVYYLRRCCPELEIVETDLHSKPRFLTEDVALVYMGSTTEQGLALAADALRPYTAEMAAKLDVGQLMLLTGNAPDVFSDAMDSDSADTIKGLGILPGRVRSVKILARARSKWDIRNVNLVVAFKRNVAKNR